MGLMLQPTATTSDGVYDPARRAVPQPNQPPAVQLASDAGPVVKAAYVTTAVVDRCGPTPGCPRCTIGGHSDERRSRIGEAVASERREPHATAVPVAAPAGSTQPPQAVQADVDVDWSDLAARPGRGSSRTAQALGSAAAESAEEAPPKRSRVGGLEVNMIGGVECGFDGYWADEFDGSPEQAIFYTVVEDDEIEAEPPEETSVTGPTHTPDDPDGSADVTGRTRTPCEPGGSAGGHLNEMVDADLVGTTVHYDR